MQAGIWNGLTHTFWLQGFGHFKIQTSGLSFYDTRWQWRHLCQQVAAFCSRCGTPEWWAKWLRKRLITVEGHASLSAHPSVFYWGCWRMNNDWDFLQGETINASCYLHTLRTLTVHCITHVQGRKRSSHNKWTLGLTLLLCACRGLNWLEKSPPSTLQSRPSPLRHPSIWVCKGSDDRLELYNQRGSPEAVYCCLWTAEMEFHCKISKISRIMPKLYKLGWGFCIEVNTVGRFVSHYMLSYSCLYFNVQ